ncbi:MAG: tRNA lysidine(34) synthetase TilS [Verrucomicrobiota bacterium]|nr:tRNA lysidine(34) synthetase TilS [Verrucomicrobiota bacterium]
MGKKLRPASDWSTEALRDFPFEKRYLVAVSGGRDSVVLLHWLISHGYRKLVVCHLDHKLRGRASSGDARFVERLAKSFGLPFVLGRTDVLALAKKSKRSIETAARVARLDFFARVSRRRRCFTLFLGHHADDLVETFLMNLFRGVGGSGRVMQPVSIHSVAQTKLTIVRPLLGVWRTEIDSYVRGGLQFREDASNRDLQPTRNRMRHTIIPFLEKEFGREIRAAIWRTATISAEEHALLDSFVAADLPGTETLNVHRVRELPIALQRRALRGWLQSRKVTDIGFELVENVRALVDAQPTLSKINLPGDRHARRRAGEIFLE